MAALSAVKNKKAAKMREGIEDLAVRCGSHAQGEGVNVALLLETLKSQNISLDDKEARRLDRASTDGKIPRADFVDYAKGSRAVKALLEKEGRPATPGSNRKGVKMDKAAAAFRAIDTDHSGFLDREEFLKFTSKMPERQQEKLLANLDKDGDGKIDMEEFRQLFNKK